MYLFIVTLGVWGVSRVSIANESQGNGEAMSDSKPLINKHPSFRIQCLGLGKLWHLFEAIPGRRCADKSLVAKLSRAKPERVTGSHLHVDPPSVLDNESARDRQEHPWPCWLLAALTNFRDMGHSSGGQGTGGCVWGCWYQPDTVGLISTQSSGKLNSKFYREDRLFPTLAMPRKRGRTTSRISTIQSPCPYLRRQSLNTREKVESSIMVEVTKVACWWQGPRGGQNSPWPA